MIVCAPALNPVAAVVNRANPPARLALPSCVPPSKKVTPPVGAPPNELPTVAVNVTACPYADGFTLALTAVVVPAVLTVCAKAPDVLPEKLLSPPYVAVIE